MNGTFNPAGTIDIRGGSVTFTSPNVSISGPLVVSSGTVSFNTQTTNINPSSIGLSGTGTITGSDVITTAGLFTWNSGTVGMATSSETINANGGMSISGNRDSFLGGTINNNGIATWTGGSIIGPVVYQATAFNNNVGSNFNIECDQEWGGFSSTYPQPDQFNNYGTLTKSVTTGTTYITAEFNNSGMVNVQTGTLALNGGGNQTGSFSVGSGATLGFGGGGNFQSGSGVTGAGILAVTGGTLAMNTVNAYTGGTTVNGGALIEGVAGALPSGKVTITGGKLILDAGTGISQITSLAMSGTGVFDISNNEIIINYGSGPDPISSVAALIASGYARGAWNGPGIISSTAANTPGYGVGYADSADPGNPADLPSGTIEVKYTLLGDADLNGTVNGIDFGILAANFNKGITGWDEGDFDYNNIVNGIDFGDLAANYNKGVAGAAGAPAWTDSALLQFAAVNGLLADVPEPATASILAFAGAGLLRRRRRK